jgi:hypothetical protein
MVTLSRLISIALVVAACGTTKAVSPDAGTDGPGATCAAGAACDLDGAQGLCSGGACGECRDTLDDAACQAAYGAGTLCVQGGCVAATCHAATDCSGGQQCIDNQCAGCTTDDDCDSGQLCVSGTCTSGGNACSGKSVGQTCGTGDLCCTRQGSLSCVEVACCTDAQCASGQTCQGGTCIASTSQCTAPTEPLYFVDPTYTGPSTGTATCPFKTLHGAFAAVRNDDFLGDSEIRIKGTIDATSEGGATHFPLTVPSSVFLRTDPTAATDAVIIAPANTTAFEAPFVAQAAATQPWSARLSHLTIQQAAAGTAGAAVIATGGTASQPIHLDHLTVFNFFNGLNVEGGHALVAFGVDVHDNADAGLRIAGGQVQITVTAAADASTTFHKNKFGIAVSSDPSSQLVISSSEDSMGFKRVSANNNTNSGLLFESPNPGNSLTDFGSNLNGTNGIAVAAGSVVKVRHGRFKQNMSSGIRVIPNGTLIDVSHIDLGFNDPGLNELGANPDADLCIALGAQLPVLAAGNVWDGTNCATGGTVPLHHACSGVGAGVGTIGPAQIAADVSQCALQ